MVERRNPHPSKPKGCGTRKFNEVRLGVVEGSVTRQHFDPSEWWSPPRVGWSTHFSPKRIKGVVELASGFPPEQRPYDCHNQILSYITPQIGDGVGPE
jgi:hypothetical protein